MNLWLACLVNLTLRKSVKFSSVLEKENIDES